LLVVKEAGNFIFKQKNEEIIMNEIKINENNQTPEAILLSNNSGVGKTTKIPELYHWDGNTFLVTGCDPVELSDNLIRAKFSQWFHGEFKGIAEKQPVLLAFSRDYLGTFHEKSVNKTGKNPISNPKKILSAYEYRKNYIRANISQININDVIKLLDTDATDNASKSDIIKLVNKFKLLFEVFENLAHYEDILANEEKDRARFESLTAAGFTNITRTGDTGRIIAKIGLSDAQNAGNVLLSNNFSLEKSDVSLETGLITLTFSEIAE